MKNKEDNINESNISKEWIKHNHELGQDRLMLSPWSEGKV
jgi:hypothetical protein